MASTFKSRYHKVACGRSIVIAVAILSVVVAVIPGALFAASNTWSSQADWAAWSKSNTSDTAVPGSLTLTASTGSWVGKSIPANSSIAGLWGTSGSDIWAVGASGQIDHYSGSSWSAVTSPTAADLTAIWGASSSDIWAVGASQAIIHYNGSTWSTVSSPSSTSWGAIWGSSASDIWIGGSGGNLAHYNGSTWSRVLNSNGNTLRAMWGSSSANVWAVGDTGAIIHYNGGGWSTVASGTSNALRAVWGSSGSDVWAAGDAGTIIHYNGSAWSSVTSPVSNALYGVWGTSSANVWAVGDTVILHYDGSNWSKYTSSPTTLEAVWGASSSDVWSAGIGSSAYHYGSAAYASSGYATVDVDAGGQSNWASLGKSDSTNGQTITYYAESVGGSTCANGGSWSGWTRLSFAGNTADLSQLASGRYLCLGIALATSDSGVTPAVNSLTLDYTAVATSGGGAAGGTSSSGSTTTTTTKSSSTSQKTTSTNSSAPVVTSTTSVSPAPTPSPTVTAAALVTIEGSKAGTGSSSLASATIFSVAASKNPLSRMFAAVAGSSVAIITAVAVAAPIVSNIALAADAALNWPLVARGYWLSLVGLFDRRRKRTPWGRVVDSITGEPIAKAIVTLHDHDRYGRVVDQTLSDVAGRFAFLVGPGNFSLWTQKVGYMFPGARANYRGETFEAAKDDVVFRDLACDRIDASSRLGARLNRAMALLDLVHLPLLIIGTVSGLYYYWRNPSWYIGIVVALYLALWSRELIQAKRIRRILTVVDALDRPLAFAPVRLVDPKTNRTVWARATNARGEVFILTDPGSYALHITDPRTARTTNQPLTLARGVVARSARVRVA